MTIEESIYKAIEGGYDGEYLFQREEQWGDLWDIQTRSFLFDPLFWEALGKAEGWDKIDALDADIKTEPCWKMYWHRLIDVLSAGKTIDQFFDELYE